MDGRFSEALEEAEPVTERIVIRGQAAHNSRIVQSADACPWQLCKVLHDNRVHPRLCLGLVPLLPLRWGTQVAGREGDVPIEDRAVSRHHARLTCQPDGVVIEDLGSRNGVAVNRHRVTRCSLGRGDVLRIGHTLLVVENAAAAANHVVVATKAATGLLPVVLQGETGTGKEVLARLIHTTSGRPGPYHAINCAGLPSTLAESELFGHAKGAFSGAAAARVGLIAAAHGGTLLLDEVADLGLDVQAKLLRALETRTIRPLGTNDETRVDIRVLAATPIDLRAAVASGRFRRDLYGRLAGRVIQLLPLRERRTEILSLFAKLAAEHSASFRVSVDAAERLLLDPWPENVRGLKLLVARAVEDIPPGENGFRLLDVPTLRSVQTHDPHPGQPPHSGATWNFPCDSAPHHRRPRPSRDELRGILNETNWNIALTAKILNRQRSLVHRWINRYDLRRIDR